jgi:hypothetical protein
MLLAALGVETHLKPVTIMAAPRIHRTLPMGASNPSFSVAPTQNIKVLQELYREFT